MINASEQQIIADYNVDVIPDPATKKNYNEVDDKDNKIIEVLLPHSRNTLQSNLTQVELPEVTKKTKICFVLAPEWSPYMPPYAIARLGSITRLAGYETHAFDINIASWRDKGNWSGLTFDPWNDVYMTRWYKDEYYVYIHNHLKPLLDEYVDKIVNLNPTVVGFTLYECNRLPTEYIIERLRERLPDIYIVLGGPSCHIGNLLQLLTLKRGPDYLVAGEGEELILQVLDEIEQGIRPQQTKTVKQDINQRIQLDELPFPDYSFFDNNLYKIPNGVLMEFSRGCIAKCVFCDETHFWKFRDRRSTQVLEEVKRLYSKGINTIWFVDSLVNGNLKELRAFAKGVIDSGMRLNWTGWARCDGRMDYDYYKDLKHSGCIHISYGVESGSNKVLKDMNKKITNTEIEQNFKDSSLLGMYGNAMIILGFPTEEYIDFYETMVMLHRIRNYNVDYIAAGLGLNIADDNIMGRNRHVYNVSPMYYLQSWIRNDFTNSKAHRHVRVKMFNIFLDNIKNKEKKSMCLRPGIKEDYKLELYSDVINDIEYEQFDFNICKPNINSFADSLVNEVWTVLRLFYRIYGSYKIEIVFNADKDMTEFGILLATDLNALIKFEINENGEWSADFTFDYKQPKLAWGYHFVSEIESNAVKRIQIFSDDSVSLNHSRATQIKMYTEHNNSSELDFTFKYQYKDTGKW